MSRFLSRRRLIAAGAAASVGTLANGRAHASAGEAVPRSTGGPAVLPDTTPAGPLVVYFEPIRCYDSRTDLIPLGGAKLPSGESIAVTVPVTFEDSGFAIAVFVNCTITDTEGFGYLVLRGSDLSGLRPFPQTSNINWSTSGQTLANLTLCTVGGENAIEVHAGGNGRTHVIVDLQGYVPFVP